MSIDAKGAGAVRASKRPRLSDGQPWQKLELFPTPPWATRALIQRVPLPDVRDHWGAYWATIWEPCSGLGHMSDTLREVVQGWVFSTDVYNWSEHNRLQEATFVDATDREQVEAYAKSIPGGVDWVITNPPFGDAEKMLPHFLHVAKKGVALLLRLQWRETEGRYENVFSVTPPTLVAEFTGRVAMCEGGYDPDGDTATAYAWFIWLRDSNGAWRKPDCWSPDYVRLDTFLIPPNAKKELVKPHDLELAKRHVPGWVPPSVEKKERARIKRKALVE